MDRRNFIRKGALAVLASQLGGASLLSAYPEGKRASTPTEKDDNKGRPASDSWNPAHLSAEEALKVRFLGTGAADWTAESYRGEHRNWSSVLIDNHILIDYTSMAKSMIPKGCHPKTIFYTHSHPDHFNVDDALELGIKTVYLSATWAGLAEGKFQKAAASSGGEMPEIICLDTLKPYEVDGVIFTPLPANHGTGIAREQALIYLMEKGSARVLYATDTGGIMASGAQHAGFDMHSTDRRALTGMIMEATMGLDYDEDFRIFTHSSVNTVLRIAHVLQNTNLYAPKNSEPIFLTHLARTLHAPQSELLTAIPEPLYPAFDGLEVDFACR